MNFRLVTNYQATGRRTAMRAFPAEKAGEPPIMKEVIVSRPGAALHLRADRTSSLPGFKQSRKSYNDILMRLKAGSWNLFTTLRELAAMASYKIKGYI